MSSKRVAIAIALPTLLAGCNGDDDDTFSEPTQNEPAEEAPAGNGSGSQDLGDIAIPVPAGLDAALTTDAGGVKVYT